ncbi:hypothetical protein lerEdw1_008594 [Lerista edwardsae]|nr:hypothetical protein lerEdw1_008594 [Lerista edwardsae]
MVTIVLFCSTQPTPLKLTRPPGFSLPHRVVSARHSYAGPPESDHKHSYHGSALIMLKYSCPNFGNQKATLGAIFGVTTCLSAQIRDEPEDPLNYFIGGCASGTVLGARAHSFATGMSACLGLGLLAALTKIGKQEGWRIVGPPRL